MTLTTEQVKTLKSFVKKGDCHENFSLRPFTTIKIGGPAQLFIQSADTEELRRVFTYCKEHKISLFILGGGSNLLFSDKGYQGVVLKIANMHYELDKNSHGARLELGAGYIINLAATKLIDEQLSGFEYLYGLPGSVGGAIYMNSKWPKSHFAISDVVTQISYLSETGVVEAYDREHTQFGYGFSEFQRKNGIVLSVTFQLKEANRSTIQKLCQEVMQYRRETQPTGVLTAGCVFKNITEEERINYDLSTRSAGYLIDKAGFKNTKYGGLLVSPVHANFFVNTGKATAKGYSELVALIKEKVREKFGVVLREEVVVVQ